MEFFINHMWEIFFGLVAAGALAFCKYLHGQLKGYQKYQKEEEQKKVEQAMEVRLEPLIKDVEELRNYIISIDTEETRHINLIISSYRYRLIALCKGYILQGYITLDQYEQLNEFYQVYSGLGGNGQAKTYYETAIQLPKRKIVSAE